MVSLTLTEDTLRATLNKALVVLKCGGVVAYPTETFYGLGAKFDMPVSLKRLYELKRRPAEKAMPVIIGDRALLAEIVSAEWIENMSFSVKSLMEAFWPGPLTLLLPAKEGISEYVTANTGKIAVRVPGESFALHLARKAGFPFTATSANPSGLEPADRANKVKKYFGEGLDLLIDGGRTPGGLPSTIVDASGEEVQVVREGAIAREEIERALSEERALSSHDDAESSLDD